MSELSLSDVFYSVEDTEPQSTPTVDATEESPGEEATDEVQTDESEALDDEAVEPEESEDSEGEEANEQEELLYIDLDGEEVSLDDIREWKAGHMKDADYRRKTQAIAEERKSLEADREALSEERSKLADLSAQLEVLVAEDGEVNWEELKEYEPERYIELKEKADKRRKALDKIKAESSAPQVQALSQEELKAESDDLFFSQGWKSEDGKLNEKKYKEDQEMLLNYLSEAGYSQEEYSQLNRSHHFKSLLDAARYNQKQKKGSALKKKVKAAPKATKPKEGKVAPKSAADVFYS